MIANQNDGNSPRVEAATPIIDVSAEGLITATTEQEAGYVPGGAKSATQQLPTQAAKTVTPGTTAQTAVAAGRYTTGAVTVKGDANLKAENIAEGVSIFGVTGTHSGGGGGQKTAPLVYANVLIMLIAIPNLSSTIVLSPLQLFSYFLAIAPLIAASESAYVLSFPDASSAPFELTSSICSRINSYMKEIVALMADYASFDEADDAAKSRLRNIMENVLRQLNFSASYTSNAVTISDSVGNSMTIYFS